MDGADPESAVDAVYPEPDWQQVTPDEAGVRPNVLRIMADVAGAGDSDCLVVTRNGQLVGEWYLVGRDATTPGDLFSTTKSLTSALVGIASDRGELDIDEPVSKYITEWQGTDSEDVTIRNLLSNDSGREWNLATDHVSMVKNAADKTQFSIDLGQQFDPGELWEYNNSAVQTLEAVLKEATGTDVGDYAQKNLFEPIGMAAEYGRDSAGNALTYSGARSTCRDLAKFGYLWMRDGQWNGEQVVSADYVEASVTPSTSLNHAYGYLFWLNRPGPWKEPTTVEGQREGEGPRFPDVPTDVFFASGSGGQVVVAYPSTGVVFSRMSPDPDQPAIDVVTELMELGAELVADGD